MNYEVFSNKNKRLGELYPELAFVASGLSFTNDSKITLDTICRFVIYYYDRNCELHPLHTNVLAARKEALGKFDIPRRVYEDVDFCKTESEMAKRYMLWNRDNEFSVYVTISMQLEDLNDKIRTMKSDSNMKENVDSLSVSSKIIELSEKIDARKKSLFGDQSHIDRYAINIEIQNKYKAENAML